MPLDAIEKSYSDYSMMKSYKAEEVMKNMRRREARGKITYSFIGAAIALLIKYILK